MQMLNPSIMPLKGQNLIEASAGTGKTYTITGLYLRCLLGLQVHEKNIEPLSIDQILVVTFTEAATQEIKDRVRGRIVAARDVLLGNSTDDQLINAVLDEIDDKKRAFLLLDAAAKSMDEAAIFTIHGFCQRMLKQHAFESNMGFNLSFVLDSTELVDLAVKDHWRSFLYPLDEETTETILQQVSSPYALASKIRPLLDREAAKVTPQYNLQDVLDARKQYQLEAQLFKQQLLSSDFFEVLANSGLAKNKAPGRVANIDALINYCQSDDWYFEFGSAKHSFNLWSEDTLSDPQYYKKGAQPLTHPMLCEFTKMAQLHELQKVGLPLAIAQHGAEAVKKRLAQAKAQHSVITPDDLLTQLYTALNAEQGAALAQKIASLFPMAMIDEFQDTDPIQYGIFSTIYAQDDTTLTMIGDPKQAIYGFRGADIFTYITAKEHVMTENQYTLATNYRSSKGVVSAVNEIFMQHENSFIYNKAIPFVEVDAQGKGENKSLFIDQLPANPLTMTVLTDSQEVTPKGTALFNLAKIFANKAKQLLTQAQKGQALIGKKPVKAGDICFLVRDRNEAAVIKSALSAQGIASVYLSRESVFNQDISKALVQFLKVLHGAASESDIRGILAGPLCGLSYQQIHDLQYQELDWQAYLEQFIQLKATWYKQGVMAMLERLLVDNNLLQVWQDKGYHLERWLTDYRHLAELLQHKQIELDGAQRVLRWFEKQFDEAQSDAGQVRLESDANLVKIVTMHASKGLEYPIVYLPFVTSYREADKAIYHHNGELIYDLSPDDDAKHLAEKERLAEDIRLLYVALTRAVHHCDVGMYQVADGRSKKTGIHKTALGFVLFGASPITSAQQWQSALQALCEQSNSLSLACYSIEEVAETDYDALVNEQQASVVDLAIRPIETAIEKNWRATSFSQLSYHQEHDDRPLGAMDENHLIDLPSDDLLPQKTPYTFPKGAKPGSCLHEIFEQIDFTQPELAANECMTLSESVEKSLQKYNIDPEWQTDTEQWIKACLQTQLNEGLSLSHITTDKRLVEMEFNLPLKVLNDKKLNALLLKITGHPSKLRFDTVQGMLKGFIDLIFEHNGQYFILDYKSNFLGDNPADYAHSNLDAAMAAHQYHLQYLIYSVALHRLLKHRLADYSPEQHLGGVYYLFLRAMPDNSGVFYNKLAVSDLLELDALFESGESL